MARICGERSIYSDNQPQGQTRLSDHFQIGRMAIVGLSLDPHLGLVDYRNSRQTPVGQRKFSADDRSKYEELILQQRFA